MTWLNVKHKAAAAMLLFVIVLLLFVSCKDGPGTAGSYPEWLSGKTLKVQNITGSKSAIFGDTGDVGYVTCATDNGLGVEMITNDGIETEYFSNVIITTDSDCCTVDTGNDIYTFDNSGTAMQISTVSSTGSGAASRLSVFETSSAISDWPRDEYYEWPGNGSIKTRCIFTASGFYYLGVRTKSWTFL